MSAKPDADRKWHRKTTEEKLRVAVFAAMRESRSLPVSPSNIARHAGLSKSLIYKHFGTVDVLVDEAIRKQLAFPPLEHFNADLDNASDQKNLGPKIRAKILEEFGSRPELLDLIGWSIGNPSTRAIKVVKALNRYCEGVSEQIGAGLHLTPAVLGLVIMSVYERDISTQNLRRVKNS